jgi:hypothetical protein
VGKEIPIHPGYDFGLGFAVRQPLGRGKVLGSEGEYTWAIFNTVSGSTRRGSSFSFS